MAPALTQASESPDLTDATRHSLPPKAITNIGSSHDHIKILKKSCKSSFELVLTESTVLISNGDCISSGLAPPACGRAEGRPEPNTSPSQFNMDEYSPESISRNSGNQEPAVLPESRSSSEINMGLQSCLRNISIVSDPIGKKSEVVTSNLPNEESPAMLHNPDFLALMGQDFNNVNDIINTLQSLASNPELLDATARDLATSTVPQCSASRIPIVPVDRKTIALNHLLQKQHHLERRRNFLACRLHRITARGLGVNISKELSYIVKYARCIVDKDQAPCQRTSLRSKSKLENIQRESMKSVSTAYIESLLKHDEVNRKDIGNNDKNIDTSISLPSLLRSEINTVLSDWKSASINHRSHDSDATESSSGGESCDENEQFNKINIDYKPIRQRAFYKYCRNRGWIASKWMWLQAQITELDNKIAVQEKLHLKYLVEKGEVKLLQRAGHLKGHRRPADLDMQDPALTCITSPLSTRNMINGYHPNSKLANVTLTMQSGSGETVIENGCSRTAGVLKIRKQKYINLKNMKLKLCEKSLGQSDTKHFTTVRCNCSLPISCILCLDSFHSRKNLRTSCENLCDQSIKQKLALIDSSFHPVLSRKPGVLQSETFNKLLRSWEWQLKAFKGKLSVKNSNLSTNCVQLNEDTDEESNYEIHSKRRRRDYKRNGKRSRDERFTGHRVTRRNHGSSFDDDEDELSGGWAIGSSHSSPCPSPGFDRSAKCDKNGTEFKGEGRTFRKHSVSTSMASINNITTGSMNHRFKQNSSSYDINNIVIPCMPAPPKLETIKCKEIPTPKWRIADIEPLDVSSSNDIEEDTSEDAINARHSRSEAMEHKKFLHYLQINQVNSTRSSRSRRTDSSGTNTPDHPLSPRALENSPTGSPPGTPPMTPSEDSLPAVSDIVSSDQTVLTLSLSSILSSEKPIELANTEENTSCTDAVQPNNHKVDISIPKPPFNSDTQDPKPALRTRRVLSGHIFERTLRSTSTNSILEEQNDRVSPFPSRDFPLTESDYQVLVMESSTWRDCSSKTQREHMDSIVEVATNNELESGPRDSPLSELTDSALEEDVAWEDESSPDWTISAVHDHSGGFVLQVQKN